MKILVTGSAGFIGMHVAESLLKRGDDVVGIDNLNDYYDINLKKARLQRLSAYTNYTHVHADIADRSAVESLFSEHKPQRVIHLAAQAGVQYSTKNPHVYVDSNLVGFLQILEACRHHSVKHLVFASTSSVYGSNTQMPYSEHESTEHPLTFYAATKKANEMMAHSYSHLYGLPCTGLRFFTVYGPWGRPDMAFFSFTKAIANDEVINVFNYGNHTRDFTYIDDIVAGVVAACDCPATANMLWRANAPDPATSNAPYRIYNIGNAKQIPLMRYIELIEKALGKKAKMNFLPLQSGDVPDTWADITEIERELAYKPVITVEQGIPIFVEWYRGYYQI